MLVNNIKSTLANITSDANEAKALVKELVKIPAVENVQVWHCPEKEYLGVGHYSESITLHAKFTWHDHMISLRETGNYEIVVKYDNKKLAKIFWSASSGMLEVVTLNLKPTRAQLYIKDQLYRAIYKLSAIGKSYKKIAMGGCDLQVGEYKVYTEGSTVYAQKGNNEIAARICGNTWRGCIWRREDPEYKQIQEIIRNNFVKY